MANVVLNWPDSPAEEMVTRYIVKMDGELAGETAEPTFIFPDISPGAHEFTVTPMNIWGPGPESSPVSTPPICSQILGANISIQIII